MGPKHGGHHGGGGGGHEGGGQGGRGGQGGGQSGGMPDLKERINKIHEELKVLQQHDHLSDEDVEKIMKILPVGSTPRYLPT